MNLFASSSQLAEPSQVESLLPDYGFEGWMVPAGLAILLGLLALYQAIQKQRNKVAGHKGNPREAAFTEAHEELAEVDCKTSRQAAVRGSLILRKYLAQASNDPSLFETHEEFITRQDSLAALTDEAREACAVGFSKLAALKYAPHEATDESAPEAVIEDTRLLLHTLHHGFRA